MTLLKTLNKVLTINIWWVCIKVLSLYPKSNIMNTQVQEIEISVKELIEVVINEVETMSKPPFINIVMETPFTNWVKKSKIDGTINPFWKQVTKETKKTYLPIFDYKGRNDNNRDKEGIEGEHQLGELKGKKHVSKCILTDIETESIFYIMVEQFDEVKPSKTIYRHNGNEIEKSMFEKWITFYDNYTSQEQVRKVQVLTPMLKNIKSITINGQKYTLK